jgi:hypothetical protein
VLSGLVIRSAIVAPPDSPVRWRRSAGTHKQPAIPGSPAAFLESWGGRFRFQHSKKLRRRARNIVSRRRLQLGP